MHKHMKLVTTISAKSQKNISNISIINHRTPILRKNVKRNGDTITY